ncbi:MAG: Copper-sensing transcriptional repressor CsoR [Firmicutes bacterium ADurb.Bin080]|jgi:CsoR family transcriptional regulator, copper-sensing transcriptional repressor|nr:MAG: Copper-sensing transcriptional repressor CsoR [Firmicutes bacterium ADurb.Bin080]
MRNESLNKDLTTRLNKLEGQIKGLKKMIEEGAACEDLMVQILACEGALQKIGKKIVINHLTHCVHDGVKEGKEEMMTEFSKILERFMK